MIAKKSFRTLCCIVCFLMMPGVGAQNNDVTLQPEQAFNQIIDDPLADPIATPKQLKTICGTWNFQAPAASMHGKSVKGSLGKFVAQKKIKKKLKKPFEKLGFKKNLTQLELRDDGTFSLILAGKRFNGDYTYYPNSKRITLNWTLVTIHAYLVPDGKKKINLLFTVDKLLKIARIAGIFAGDTAAQITLITQNFDDILVGFQFKKK